VKNHHQSENTQVKYSNFRVMVSNVRIGSARPKTHTDMVLHNLNLEVPNWTVKDVSVWIKKIGFEKYVDDIIELELDGDLLLKLDESNLQSDLNITNGILRKRFMRELNSLKRNADYSAKDRHGIARMIKSYKPDLMIYANDLIEAIDEPGYLHNMTLSDLDDHLQNVANIKSVIHRQEIIKVLDDSFCQPDSGVQSDNTNDSSFSRSVSLNSADSCPVYMSHAGPHETEQLASLIALQLQLRGFSLFESKLDKNINISVMVSEEGDDCGVYDSSKVLERSYTESMEKCSHLVLVLGQGSLDQLMKKSASGNANVQVPLYYEIVAALKSKKTTIIPVLAPGFQFPDPDDLLPEVRALLWMNAVNFIHEYREASIDKIEKFIRGEVFCKSVLDLTSLTINDGCGLQKVKTLTRSGWSTPGSSVHLAPPSFNNGCRSRYASSTDIAMN